MKMIRLVNLPGGYDGKKFKIIFFIDIDNTIDITTDNQGIKIPIHTMVHRPPLTCNMVYCDCHFIN